MSINIVIQTTLSVYFLFTTNAKYVLTDDICTQNGPGLVVEW